jgi:hypothetical protein
MFIIFIVINLIKGNFRPTLFVFVILNILNIIEPQ